MDFWRFAVFCAAFIGVGALRVTKLEAPQKAQAGDTVTFKCNYDLEGGPLYSVKIYHNKLEFYRYLPGSGNWAFPEKDMTVDLEASDDKQVTLKNVTVNHSGEYQCEVTLDQPLFTTSIVSHNIIISKSGVLREVKIHLPQSFQEGANSAVLNCTYNLDGLPLKNITWYKNQVEFYHYKPGNPPSIQFTPQPGVDVLVPASDDKHVTLQNIKLETGGNYRCQVSVDTHPPQTQSADAHLKVAKVGRLNNVRISLPQNVYSGDESAIFECDYDLDGVLLHAVKWYKDGKYFYQFQPNENPPNEYISNPEVTVDVTRSSSKHLYITNLRQETSGVYRCEVQSFEPIVQSSSAEATFIVLILEPTTEKPSFFNRAGEWFRNKWNSIRNRD